MAKDIKAIDYFKEVMLERYGVAEFIQYNQMLYTKVDNVTLLTIPDNILWENVINDEDLQKITKPLNPNQPDSKEILSMFEYVDDIDGDKWFGIDSDVIYKGGAVNVHIDAYNYSVPVSRVLFPKLKKAEYNNFSYRVYLNPKPVLALKKKYKAPGCTFTVIRTFIVL